MHTGEGADRSQVWAWIRVGGGRGPRITFEREQLGTIQAHPRNRHDPKFLFLYLDLDLDTTKIRKDMKIWFYRFFISWRYGESWTSEFFYPEHHLSWGSRIWNFWPLERPRSTLVKITSQKIWEFFMKPGGCGRSQTWVVYLVTLMTTRVTIKHSLLMMMRMQVTCTLPKSGVTCMEMSGMEDGTNEWWCKYSYVCI